MEELDLTNSPAAIQEDIVCRICLANKSEVPHLKLIRPCLCSGTQAHVHVQCLDHWRSVSAAAGQHSCSTCGHSYRKRSSVKGWFWQGIVDGSMCMSLCAVAYGVTVTAVGGLLWAADVTNMPFLGLPLLTQLDDARLCYPPSSAQGVVIACGQHLVIANLLVSFLVWIETNVRYFLLSCHSERGRFNDCAMNVMIYGSILLEALLYFYLTEHRLVMNGFWYFCVYPVCWTWHCYPMVVLQLQEIGSKQVIAARGEYLEPSSTDPAEVAGRMMVAGLLALMAVLVVGVVGVAGWAVLGQMLELCECM